MFLNIILIIMILGAVFFDFRTMRYLRTNHTNLLAVVNLKRALRPFTLIFIALMGFVLFKNQDETIFTQSLVVVFVLLVIKMTYLNPKRIVVTETSVNMALGEIPVEAISLFTITPEGKLAIKIHGINRLFTFTPRAKEDYDTILKCAEEYNIGQARDIIQKHRLAQITAEVKGVFPLSGTIKDYDWGGKSYLAKQMGLEEQQIAEVWYGTHPAGLSSVTLPGSMVEESLLKFYTKHPEQSRIEVNPKQDYSVLLNFMLAYGQPILANQANLVKSKENPDELPFLFKTLDVARPLSIQIHPTKDVAIKGYAAEDKAGINLNSSNRTFKDRNHKPEMALALSDLYLLHGMDSKENILAKLEGKPALTKLRDFIANAESVGQAYKQLFTASKEELKDYLAEHLQTALAVYSELIEKQLDLKNIIDDQVDTDDHLAQTALLDPDYWMAFTYSSLCMEDDNLDVGLLSFYMLNLVKVVPGQAIFQGPNLPHAYLRGRLVEVMANSDNVVRGGLTTKHINTELYLKLVDTKPMTPRIYENNELEQIPSQEWSFEVIRLTDGESYIPTNAMVALFMRGNGNLTYSHSPEQQYKTPVKPWNAVFVSAGQKFSFKGDKQVLMFAAQAKVLPDVYQEASK